MSRYERQTCLYDSQPVARLVDDKKRQVIRLVNPSDTKIGFVIEIHPPEGGLKVVPRSGFVPPRNYKLIFIDNPNYMGPTLDRTNRLNLIYLIQDSSRRRGYSKRLIPIDMVGKARHSTSSIRGNNSFIWSIVRSTRSIILIGLILYNILLIKLCFDK